ncbi:MAG: FAD-dependent monooxygenase [Alphaproteobacteria bacterium]
MTGIPDSVDVLVVGGGPAGSATAARVARLGHSVCVVERGSNVWHRGFAQSLAPGALSVLETLGVRDEVKAVFPRSRGVTLLWGEDRPQYREFADAGGLEITRAGFDRILCSATQRSGAILLSPADVIDVRRALTRDWLARVALNDTRFDIRARIVVDAAGRRAKVPVERIRTSLPLIGILGLWRGSGIGEQSIVEAAADCWYWASARADSTTAAVFFDPRSGTLSEDGSLLERYRRLIANSRLLRGLSDATLMRVEAHDATSRHVGDPLEPGLIRVGECAVSLDPLSSQGIQAAITSGLQAAIVVNTWLRRPDCASAADAFYRNRHAETIQRSRDDGSRIYAEAARRYPTPFWQQRGALQSAPDKPAVETHGRPIPHPQARLRLASGVRVRSTPVVRDDLAVFAPAIVRSGTERPVAFLEGMPVGELAEELVTGAAATHLVKAWSERVGEMPALKVLAWMWQAGVIVESNAA